MSNLPQIMALIRQREMALSALRVIYTWATFESGQHMEATEVANLIKGTFEKIEATGQGRRD